MSTITTKDSFSIGRSTFVLPNVKQLKKTSSDEVARIIFLAARLMFIHKPKIKDKYYEYYPDEDRLTIFLKPSRRQVTLAVSFLTMKEFPILFACPHYLYDLDKRESKMFMDLFLLLKFELYDQWLLSDYEDREKLYNLIRNGGGHIFHFRPNLEWHLSMRTDKWHKPVGEFDKHLQYKKIQRQVLLTLEKAYFEIEG